MKPPQFCMRCAGALAAKSDGERPRLVCIQCGYVAYDSPVPVVAALVTIGSDAILVRSQGWPTGMFGLVTGYLEQQEEPADGALRELREELGLGGVVQSIIGAYAFSMKNEVMIAYHVEASGEIALGAELAEYKRIPIAKLRPWPIATGLAVRDWLAARSAAAP